MLIKFIFILAIRNLSISRANNFFEAKLTYLSASIYIRKSAETNWAR